MTSNGIQTVWGVKWPTPSVFGVIIVLIILLIVLLIFLLIKYNQNQLKKKLHSQQLFLFRSKQIGLSNFQIKILKGIANIQQLKEPSDILHMPYAFEKSIGTFLQYITGKSTPDESFKDTCEEIVITYEKTFNKSNFRKGINKLEEIEAGHLLCLKDNEFNNYFIGKILTITNEQFCLQLFRKEKFINKLDTGTSITCILWRTGDAEYSFDSKVLSLADNKLCITIPEKFTRYNEAIAPLIDVLIPVKLEIIKENSSEKISNINATIIQLNDEELILKTRSELNFVDTFKINFFIDDFKIDITLKLIAEKTTIKKDFLYYTFKYIELSDASKNILRTTVRERLFND